MTAISGAGGGGVEHLKVVFAAKQESVIGATQTSRSWPDMSRLTGRLTSVRKVADYVLSANPPCNPKGSVRGVLCGFCGGLLVGARAGEDAGERRVPLVTGVFVDRALGQRHRNGRRPRPRPGGRILDGEFVDERARISAG